MSRRSITIMAIAVYMALLGLVVAALASGNLSRCPVSVGDQVLFGDLRGEVAVVLGWESSTPLCKVGVRWSDGRAEEIYAWKLDPTHAPD